MENGGGLLSAIMGAKVDAIMTDFLFIFFLDTALKVFCVELWSKVNWDAAHRWFKWERRIYTGHQLELRSGFPCEWDSPRFHTAANLCRVCVLQRDGIFKFCSLLKFYKSHNSATTATKKELFVKTLRLFLSSPSCDASCRGNVWD